MILRQRRLRRPGFTLLEILLATLIAGLLLAALYAALYTTLLQTQATRDAVEAEDLSRGIFNKMSLDLTGTLAPLPPKSGGNSAAGGGGVSQTSSANASTANAATAPTTGSTGGAAPAAANAAPTTPTDGSTDTSMPGATDNATAVSADYAFQGGVVGEETKLVIYAGRTPETFGRSGNPGDQVRADQRQIIYWYEPNRGLYRRERPWVTADGVRNAMEADPDAPDSILLADEATSLTFAYSDGTSWASTWDGTTPGPDGVTPLGPPRAIKVTIDLRITAGRGEPITRTVTQIIAVRSAPGTYTPPLLEAPTDGASDSSGATTGDTSGMGGNTSSGAAGGMSGAGGGTSGTAGKTGGSAGGTGAAPSGGTSGASGTRPGGSAMPSGGQSVPSGGSGTGGSRPSGGASAPSGGTAAPSAPSSGTGGSRPSGGSGTGGGNTGGGRTGGGTGGGR